MSDTRITVGGELLRLRQRKGVSQFDLAVCMGWKGTNPVIQIEKDRRLPTPDTIERLGKCLGLNYLDLHYLNGLAGHVLPTRLPPPEHVTATLDILAEPLAAFPYPAYVLDYQSRFWLCNPATAAFTLGDYARLRTLMAKPLHTFDVVFDSRLGFRQRIADLALTERDQVFRFKASNAFRQHEPFMLALPEAMGGLQGEDYLHFRKTWQAVNINDLNAVSGVQAARIAEFYARLQGGDMRLDFPEGLVAFHLRVESILHLGDLFQIITLVPVDSPALPGNRALADAVMARYTPGDAGPIKVWDLLDLAVFYPQ